MRARRFDLNLPVWYRGADEGQWHSGVTETVSATATSIRADEPMPDTSPVDTVIVIALPSTAGCLIGRGRLVPTIDEDDRPAARFAISVGRFHIRSKAVLKRIA